MLVTMYVSSPQIMVLAGMGGVVVLGLLFLIKGSSIGTVVGAVSWLLIAGGVIMFELNKKDET